MKNIFLLLIILSVARNLSAQATSWSIINVSPSSYNAFNYIDKTLFESKGKIKLIAGTPEAITITLQTQTTQNGKTTVSTKQISLDTTCSAATNVGSCCYFNGLQYCIVQNMGYIFLDRNLGATAVNQQGTLYSMNAVKPACPMGWRLPKTYQEARAIGVVETKNNIFSCTECPLCWGVLAEQNCSIWHFNSATTSQYMYVNQIYTLCSNGAKFPARCVKY